MATTVTEATLFLASPGWLEAAVETLAAAGLQVVAPVKDEQGDVNLKPVASSEGLVLNNGKTLLPLKRLLFPKSEVLLEFEKRPDGDVDIEPAPLATAEVVVLGCRPCDAAALGVLDQVFQWDYDDLRYRAQRARTTVVTFACAEPDDHCFCTSVGGSPQGESGSDALVFARADGGAILKPLTDRGQRLIERLGDAVRPAPDGTEPPSPPEVKPQFDPEKVKAWLDGHFESPFWLEASLRCLGCGACSYLCPTCHCFDIVDEAVWNAGERRRNWDCCSFALFTAHASGHNPRADQAARYRQRVMHKFKYFPERFGRIACVGCGRCLAACGVGQSLVGILRQIETKNGD